jgi:hypothetical protein
VNPPSLSGMLCTFLRIVGSTISGPHSAVLVGGASGISGFTDPNGEAPGERRDDIEAYLSPGIIWRPRPPSTPQGSDNELAAEAIGFRTPDGLIPLAWRDLRLNRRFPNPKPGTVALVGYGGAFLSFDDADGDTSQGALYVPYARDGNGNVTKAHIISIGKDGNGTPFVGIISGEGPRVTLLGDQAIVASKTGAGRVEVTDDGVNAVGPFKAPNGGDIGGPTSRALAMHAELVALLTPLNALLTAITTQLSAPGPVAGAPGAYVAGLATLATAIAAVSATGKTLFTKGA